MRFVSIILLMFCGSALYGQKLTKEFIDGWLSSGDSTIQTDSVKAYFIQGQYFDLLRNEAGFKAKLDSLTENQVHTIVYSETKMDNYVPGKGTILVILVEQRENSMIEGYLKFARYLIKDQYISDEQERIANSKDPALWIDGDLIYPAQVMEALAGISTEEVYDILIVRTVNNKETYGPNAVNGLIKIWTKANMKD